MQFDSSRHRLHVLTPIPAAGREVFAGLLFFQLAPTNAIGLLIILVGATVRIGQWLRFSFFFEPNELVIDSGIFVRSHRAIPYDRIQQIHLSAGIVARVLGLNEATVETASQGAHGDVRFRFLGEADAFALQEFLLARRDAAGSADVARNHSTRRGNSSDKSTSVLGVEPKERVQEILRLSDSDTMKAGATNDAIVLGAAVLAFIPILGWAIIVVLIFAGALQGLLVNSGYRLTLDGDQLHLRRGLLQRENVRMSLQRVHKIVIWQNPVRRRFGLLSATLYSAALTDNQEQSHGQMEIPLLSNRQLDYLLSIVLPAGMKLDDVHPIPARARRRFYMIRIAPVILIAAPLAFVPSSALRLGLLGCVLASVVAAELAYRGRGYLVNGQVIVDRRRLLFRRWVVVPTTKAQEVRLHSSPFQRRLRTTSLGVPTAGVGPFCQIVDGDVNDLTGAVPTVLSAERIGEVLVRQQAGRLA